MNDFCALKGIRREFSVARTPQKNSVAERRNRTLIEATKTMLADSKLPTTFWAKAVNTACYVIDTHEKSANNINDVNTVRPSINTLSTNLDSGSLNINIDSPTVPSTLNTRIHEDYSLDLVIGDVQSGVMTKTTQKQGFISIVYEEKTHKDVNTCRGNSGRATPVQTTKGLDFGGFAYSKAFRVYNTRTERVKENLHIEFLENKPIVAGAGPKWLFDIDMLTESMNYMPVIEGRGNSGRATPVQTTKGLDFGGFAYRPNGKPIHNSILNGPYVRRMIAEPGDGERDVNVNETFHEKTDDELSERELKQIEADDQAL
nr:ribonuclease H-like domain-containing protein [Tanacetum cinerariifolium]